MRGRARERSDLLDAIPIDEHEVATLIDKKPGQAPFPADKLASLYESHGDYVRKVTRVGKRVEREG